MAVTKPESDQNDMSPDLNKNEQNQTTTKNRVDPSAQKTETTTTELSTRVDFPNNDNGRGEESLHNNQVDPKTNSTETELSKPQNKPIENNNLNLNSYLSAPIAEPYRNTLDELAQAEAVELFEKNKNNPCFLCKNFIESIFSNRKGRKASQAKNCKKCDHAVKGKPNFYK